MLLKHDSVIGCDYAAMLVISRLVNYTKYLSSYIASVPIPAHPYLEARGSTWIQLGWEPLLCDGGHEVKSYDVEYTKVRYSSYNTAGRTSNLNFTIEKLAANTIYYFRIQALSSNSYSSSYSSYISVTTHPAGE